MHDWISYKVIRTTFYEDPNFSRTDLIFSGKKTQLSLGIEPDICSIKESLEIHF